MVHNSRNLKKVHKHVLNNRVSVYLWKHFTWLIFAYILINVFRPTLRVFAALRHVITVQINIYATKYAPRMTIC